ncbi:3-keto-5-aminohexanoate cleavage protein [Halalkalicoccus sp. NIPERK01]|uniref:3-keto-5-aminohexanoate cleavage protein n=1 Tax=Halalkalicoccus sp. NIPERK01 TaxID=3053469 RepID=UPI00256F65A2|nr:3-keto-5-aminohexanoate cleavage protein [Halalkalicoccus sp. NIPERK01]MDL5360422.1 3-keto-5-aminohexanoate cleavage protein [Halalkalicoccus sp. NIPERK01]
MSYGDYLEGNPLIVTVAPTGGVHGKEAHPDLPETPGEVAETAAACEAAGAAVIHLHARRENGERSFSRDRFQELTAAVREATDDVVIQHSTGGTGVPVEDRLEPLRTEPVPEMASLDMGPVNRYHHLTSENPRGTVDALHAEMRERGIKPEMEVFNPGHLNEVEAFLDRAEVESPPYLGVLYGGGTLTPAHPRNVQNVVDNLPEGARFNTLAMGRHQLPLTTMSILLGGHVRVGFEDNLYVRAGERATSNAQLVERTREIAELLGRPVATPAQTREILDIE